MNKVHDKYNEKIINETSLFSEIEEKYNEIIWDEVKPKELEKLLNKIEVKFDVSTIEKEEEKIEYLKYLLEKEQKDYITVPSEETIKIISNIEALRTIYKTIGGKHDSDIALEITQAIDSLKSNLEKSRKDALQQEIIEEAQIQEEQERLELEEQERLELEEHNERLELEEQERLEQEGEEEEDIDMSEYDSEEQEDNEEDSNEDGELNEDENEFEDGIIQYNEDGTIKIINGERTNKDGSISTNNYNNTTSNNSTTNNKSTTNKNSTINNNSTTNNSEEHIYNENNDNSQMVNDLMERILQLESVLKINENTNKEGVEEDDNDFLDISFSSENKIGEFESNDNDAFGELGNQEIEFSNSKEDGMNFSNKESEFSLDKNSTSSNSSDQSQAISELMQRISSIESNKNKDSENRELKRELEQIKRSMNTLEKQRQQDMRNNQNQVGNLQKNQRSNRPNRARVMGGFKRQQPTREIRTIQNNRITEIVKQSNLSSREKEQLKREILSSVPNTNNSQFNSSKGSSTSMTPQEMENLVLVLADKLKLSGADATSQFQNAPMGNDPFASMGGGQNSDPFAGMSGGQNSDPFAGISGGQNSDPFAGISGGQNSDPFAGMSGGGQASDPFAAMGGQASDPFASMGGQASDPFAGMSNSNNSGSSNNTVSASDVSALQKQIKELRNIVLGKEINSLKPKLKSKVNNKPPENIKVEKPKEKPKDQWSFEPGKKEDITLALEKPNPKPKKKKFKLFDISKTTKKGGDK